MGSSFEEIFMRIFSHHLIYAKADVYSQYAELGRMSVASPPARSQCQVEICLRPKRLEHGATQARRCFCKAKQTPRARVASPKARSPSECLLSNGESVPCGPDYEQCRKPFHDAPRFHIMDPSCLMNDPNAPVYDATHGMYHVFFQKHLAIPGGAGPVYGHVVSRDLVRWARLPVAIWNDQPYDSVAVYSGSATVLPDGTVAQIYPGVCNKSDALTWPNCSTGVNLNLALPANRSDPLLVRWAKSGRNPIVNNTERDPSSAWRTLYGEWRLTTFDAMLYASVDFRSWHRIGLQPGFAVGECPSMFPLPRATPRDNAAPLGVHPTPTHVYKYSHSWLDFMQLGTYADGPPGQPGEWLPWRSPLGNESRCIDGGAFYASKGARQCRTKPHAFAIACSVTTVQLIGCAHACVGQTWTTRSSGGVFSGGGRHTSAPGRECSACLVRLHGTPNWASSCSPL